MNPEGHKEKIACEYFVWSLFRRDDVWYADGRAAKLGKHSLSTRDREQAIGKLRSLDHQMAIARGLVSTPTKERPREVSTSEGWRLFINDREVRQKLRMISADTLKRYRAVRDKHLQFCAIHSLYDWARVNKRTTERYGQWLADRKHKQGRKYAPRSIKLELRTVCSVSNFLIEEKLLDANHHFTIRLGADEDSDRYCFKREEVAAMIVHCNANQALHWLRDAIVGLATTGLRSAELAGLRWNDINLDTNQIKVCDERHSVQKAILGSQRTTKGKRSRILPLNQELRRVLEMTSRHRDGYVFRAAMGGRLIPDRLRDQFIRHVIDPLKSCFPTPPGEVGFGHGRIHSFRHFFVSECFRQGVREEQIMAWVGHRDSKVVRLYRHLRCDDSQAAMQKLQLVDVNVAPGGPVPNVSQVCV